MPVYAVPEDALDVEFEPVGDPVVTPEPDLPPVMGPDGFATHTCPGRKLDVRVDGVAVEVAAFRSDDPDLAGYVLLDFSVFDWLEEDQQAIGHPHDPFKRIDTLPSTRHVVVTLDGVVLADTRRPVASLETHLPTRLYIPQDDVRSQLLEPSDHRTTCAYKGHASHLSVAGAGQKGRAIGCGVAFSRTLGRSATAQVVSEESDDVLRVPEGRTVKKPRAHLASRRQPPWDMVERERERPRRGRVADLVEAGARVVREEDYGPDLGHVVMLNPEGNEFCVA